MRVQERRKLTNVGAHNLKNTANVSVCAAKNLHNFPPGFKGQQLKGLILAAGGAAGSWSASLAESRLSRRLALAGRLRSGSRGAFPCQQVPGSIFAVVQLSCLFDTTW